MFVLSHRLTHEGFDYLIDSEEKEWLDEGEGEVMKYLRKAIIVWNGSKSDIFSFLSTVSENIDIFLVYVTIR